MHFYLTKFSLSILFPTHDSYIYTAGVDGRVCKLDSLTGNLLDEFKASTKAISSMSVSTGLCTGLFQKKISGISYPRLAPVLLIM